jgi:hypothetical protein
MEGNMGCNCYIDAADCFSEQVVEELLININTLAGVNKTCGECRSVIPAGEKYEHYVGKFEGSVFEAITCMPCREIRDCFFCSWVYEGMYEDLEDEIYDLPLDSLELLSMDARNKLFDKFDIYFEDLANGEFE